MVFNAINCACISVGKAPAQGAQVLVCSEIGSEGRNFQFAHHLVLFDFLPLEPDLLEQRIGRLDRIGQRDTIDLHVPYLVGGASEVLLRWYRDGWAASRPPVPRQMRCMTGWVTDCERRSPRPA